jgi:hypothetical protein
MFLGRYYTLRKVVFSLPIISLAYAVILLANKAALLKVESSPIIPRVLNGFTSSINYYIISLKIITLYQRLCVTRKYSR